MAGAFGDELDAAPRADEDEELTEVVLVNKRTYFKKEGRFYIEFHEDLLPYIAQLHNNFTKYQLVNIGAFSSTHTIRLYELCSQYRDTGWKQTSIEDLKDWLQVADKYPRYNSFKKFAILVFAFYRIQTPNINRKIGRARLWRARSATSSTLRRERTKTKN